MSLNFTLYTKNLNLRGDRQLSSRAQNLYAQLGLESTSIQMTPSWMFSLNHVAELLFQHSKCTGKLYMSHIL